MARRRILFLSFRGFFGLLSLLLLSMQTLPDGFVYEHRQLEGSLSLHILEIDPQKFQIRPVHAHDRYLSLETTSSIAKRKGAFAAINGGFFRMVGPYLGSSSGILKIDGELLSSPRLNRAAIGWKEDRTSVLIDRIALNAYIECETLPRHFLKIDGINQPRQSDKAILYTPAFHTSTLTDDQGLEIIVEADHLLKISARNSTIPHNGYVYSIGPESRKEIPSHLEKMKMNLSLFLIPLSNPESQNLWKSFEHIVGGTPILIDKGKLVEDYSPEQLPKSFVEGYHPRTAIGLKQNGHWVFVVVDGRQPGFSKGMTLKELASLMHSLECEYAINLDGGGSSTLYLDEKVVNVPCGIGPESPDAKIGDERAVSDAILIFRKECL